MCTTNLVFCSSVSPAYLRLVEAPLAMVLQSTTAKPPTAPTARRLPSWEMSDIETTLRRFSPIRNLLVIAPCTSRFTCRISDTSAARMDCCSSSSARSSSESCFLPSLRSLPWPSRGGSFPLGWTLKYLAMVRCYLVNGRKDAPTRVGRPFFCNGRWAVAASCVQLPGPGPGKPVRSGPRCSAPRQTDDGRSDDDPRPQGGGPGACVSTEGLGVRDRLTICLCVRAGHAGGGRRVRGV